jgi:release factor glutamine methyltransferase
MKTILEVVQLGSKYLESRDIPYPRRQIEEIVSFVLGMKRLALYLDFQKPLTSEELDRARHLLERRGRREPLEYLIGEVSFLDCLLRVTRAVLIPRPETEALAEKVIEVLRPLSLEGKELWDLCCGSGCLGLAIKKRYPQLKVVLTDLSIEALELAKENGKRNGVEVEYLQGSLFEPLEGRMADFIISNPPYVSQREYEQLPNEVRDFEPKQALLAGPTGLEFYERFSQQMERFLRPGGRAWFEIGADQAEQVKNLFLSPAWGCVTVEQDLAGRDRFFSLERQLS